MGLVALGRPEVRLEEAAEKQLTRTPLQHCRMIRVLGLRGLGELRFRFQLELLDLAVQ